MIHDPIPHARIHAKTCRCSRCATPGPRASRRLPHPAIFGLLGIPVATAISAAISPSLTLAAILALVGR